MKLTRKHLEQLEKACGEGTVAFVELCPGGYHIGCDREDGERCVRKNIDHNKMLESQQRGTWEADWAKFCEKLSRVYREKG